MCFKCLIRWLDQPAMPLCKKASKPNNSGSASRIDDSSPNLSTAEENRRRRSVRELEDVKRTSKRGVK